jgi:uncharacterized protein
LLLRRHEDLIGSAIWKHTFSRGFTMAQHSETAGLIDYEALEDISANVSGNPTLGDVVSRRFSRRDLLGGGLAVSAVAALMPEALAQSVQPAAHVAMVAPPQMPAFNFKEVAALVDEHHAVAEGYAAKRLISWGDPVLADAKPFAPMAQSPATQAGQFGYNNDFLGFLPLPGAANPSQHGVLCVNHEYTSTELMLPGLKPAKNRRVDPELMTAERVGIEMMAHGGSVIEVRRSTGGEWAVVAGSKYARRITLETPIEITGPAAGHARMKTADDPAGLRVLGMMNNCAGGMTPWGTWVTCEENINNYFKNELPADHPEAKAHKRYGIPGLRYEWAQHHARFDVLKEANEANRFGWVVEIDPLDPASTPKKRTALGRFKHEGAAGIISKDGRYVIYSGDDQRFDYVYRFVTADRVDTQDLSRNKDILDRGTLSVARYNADGTVTWLPLVHGQGPLTEANGFKDQGDVLISARLAADLLGATKMDRPEDVEASPRTGKVYVLLTKNENRKAADVEPANPRSDNKFGHIVEMTPPDGDHGADTFTWNILVKCGDPSVAAVGATFNPATSKDGWFANPDNLAFDSDGRLWISTDGNSDESTGRNDGLWSMETEGPGRATSKLFYRCPVGAEMCGPVFTPDGETLFVAVQHPGEDGQEWKKFGRPSSFEDPPTRWPDFKPDTPPRPSIVAITKTGGGKIAV